jgi:hypothetical protein
LCNINATGQNISQVDAPSVSYRNYVSFAHTKSCSAFERFLLI